MGISFSSKSSTDESAAVENDWIVSSETFILSLTDDATITLPDAATSLGRTVTITAGAGDITVEAAGADTINGAASSLGIRVGNLRAFTATQLGSTTFSWITTNADGDATNIAPWVGLSVPVGSVLTMGASGPEWV